MCHQASFHLKFARKYPLLALKLPEIWVVFKTGSSKKKEEKRSCGIIRDTNLRLFQKKIPRGGVGGGKKAGKQYIFLWVVGADIFQIIWVIGV